ncbi:MAG: glycosyltransferase [Gammaproteobacteria bacterium]|nr:glycosyltransferase [Gammaproteobacteria bacterium]
MRLLLIAYEFPPSTAPQSLRWAYLARELSAHGHEVHVLTIDLGGVTAGLPELPATIRIHRAFPGPLRGLVALRRRYRHRAAAGSAGRAPANAVADTVGTSRTRWKLRISRRLQRFAEHLWFPDLRAEWRFWGRRALRPLLAKLQPEAVISSHEPATTLELGLEAKRAGYPWIADLGDPVLAPYTLPRWRDRAFELERSVCAEADHILVTAESARAMLQERHGREQRIEVLTQGFDDRVARVANSTATQLFDPHRLELLYSGSFYSFRQPDALVAALAAHPGARLSIAAVSLPDSVLEAARRWPERIRPLGFLPHDVVLALQRKADVLVSLANRDPGQVPGKFYEYLGACRPILHVTDNAGDIPATLVRQLKRGGVCRNDSDEIATSIGQWARAKQEGRLDDGCDLSLQAVAGFGWSRLGQCLDRIVSGLAR